MEIKEWIIIVGIIFTVLFSSLNLFVVYKNRRNTLREHLYKEQINFFSKFMSNVNKLNLEIEGIMKKSSERKANSFYELMEIVSFDYYNSEFIIPSEISGLIHNLIFKGDQFYLTYSSTDENKIRISYSNYFKSYSEVLNYIKEFIGTNKLSKENKKLHSPNDNSILKLIGEISIKARTNHL